MRISNNPLLLNLNLPRQTMRDPYYLRERKSRSTAAHSPLATDVVAYRGKKGTWSCASLLLHVLSTCFIDRYRKQHRGVYLKGSSTRSFSEVAQAPSVFSVSEWSPRKSLFL